MCLFHKFGFVQDLESCNIAFQRSYGVCVYFTSLAFYKI